MKDNHQHPSKDLPRHCPHVIIKLDGMCKNLILLSYFDIGNWRLSKVNQMLFGSNQYHSPFGAAQHTQWNSVSFVQKIKSNQHLHPQISLNLLKHKLSFPIHQIKHPFRNNQKNSQRIQQSPYNGLYYIWMNRDNPSCTINQFDSEHSMEDQNTNRKDNTFLDWHKILTN
jgi:hypothetical protein